MKYKYTVLIGIAFGIFTSTVSICYPRHPCLWLTLPAVGRVRDFHPIECALAGRTNKKSAPEWMPSGADVFKG